MSVDDYYKLMGVKHDDDCLICTIDERELKAHRGVLSHVWNLEYTPLVLAGLLVVVAYMVATSALISYVVGGF